MVSKLLYSDKKLFLKYKKLHEFITSYHSAIIAYSGGMDSSLIAYICNRLLQKTLCVIKNSPSFTQEELNSAVQFCKKYCIRYFIFNGNEFEDEKYTRNYKDRCYYCKKSLFNTIEKIRKKNSFDVIFDGSNKDDLKDYRPGKKAIKELKIQSPLLACGFSKRDIRKLSRLFGLSTWKKYPISCLSSRIPYGTPITIDTLKKIENIEKEVKLLGHRNVRARIHDEMIRLEIDEDENIDIEKLKKIIPKIKRQGFKYIVLDIEGYRTGNMNEK